MRKKILVKALSKNLDKMTESPWIGSISDAKDLICPYCDLPVQPCRSNPSATCERMLKGGTEDKELEEALKNPSDDRLGFCISCGRKISMVQFKKHPTVELCGDCTKKGRKSNSKKAV